MKSPGFCCTTVTLADTHQEGTLANYDPKMNCSLMMLQFLSKLPLHFIFHNVTILGHHKLRSFRPYLLEEEKKVQLNFANGKKERDQLLISVHIGKKHYFCF